MKFDVWCSHQPSDVLANLDYMIPELALEKYERMIERERRIRSRGNPQRSGTFVENKTFWKWLGGILVIWGGMMLIPGPVDVIIFSKGAKIGYALGGPLGAAIGGPLAVAAYNLFAMAVVAFGTWMLTWD